MTFRSFTLFLCLCWQCETPPPPRAGILLIGEECVIFLFVSHGVSYIHDLTWLTYYSVAREATWIGQLSLPSCRGSVNLISKDQGRGRARGLWTHSHKKPRGAATQTRGDNRWEKRRKRRFTHFKLASQSLLSQVWANRDNKTLTLAAHSPSRQESAPGDVLNVLGTRRAENVNRIGK